ncbi:MULTISPECIES: STAS domain-containing protein [Thalassomonas]|uniref:STAS domain-containing protein n=1 Tax=Thalassomonas actiniarum TaxID=485447 RepID=A0AAE9YLY3_9GAMM|nr:MULTISPECIES: STAS domain-containing protein [Thalassomonas]WDD96858.1 STAS domain-containing protein [Thalassomonas actiniarum]
MSIEKIVSADNQNVSIAIEDRFDFSLHQKFRESYADCDTNGTTFTLKLDKTSYMDSSALGMILLLKDHADKISGKVIINKPNETVNKILEIAQFHRLLTIEL